jgi:predicted nuclease with TOPRIM domain
MEIALDREFAGKITATLAAQHTLYAQLRDLAKQQSEFVATGQSEALMTVLAARQRLIERLAPLDKELQPYKGRWQEIIDGLEEPARGTVSKLLMDVQQLLAQILERDDADKQSLIRQKTEVGLKIQGAIAGRQLNKAYGMRPSAAMSG